MTDQRHPTAIAMHHRWSRWQQHVVDALDRHGPMTAEELRNAADDGTGNGTAIVRGPLTKHQAVTVSLPDPRPAQVYVDNAIRTLEQAGLIARAPGSCWQLR